MTPPSSSSLPGCSTSVSRKMLFVLLVLIQHSNNSHSHNPSSNNNPLPSSSPSPSLSPLPSPFLRSSAFSSSPLSVPSPLPVSSPLALPPSSSVRPRVAKSVGSTRPSTARRSSSSSSVTEDVLAPGDLIGEDILLQGQLIRPASGPFTHENSEFGLAKEFEVIRRLGTGSYAVVYLVREVLSRTVPSEDGHCGILDFGEAPRSKSYVTYGRDFALKCLSKANLDEDALVAQMTEVTIHQSLRPHSNIVTLHRTLETPAFLLLLLEYVPGEDLFYFLEQARDHYEPTPISRDDSASPSRTPPTPSLLASLHPTQLLSPTRLRLIASMFSQMCDAVASCHEQGVFHRDIKPENFIVTDGFVNGERRVVVKLTDFGLSTTEAECSDMDCGSAPYMSFECRNNVAPTYRPAPADVWSLGIVLINMLYHYNPWTDTAEGVCPSFDLFRQHGSSFFMQRFTGMTAAVADFLATRVFYLPPSTSLLSTTSTTPVTAHEFGTWIKDLPALLSESTTASRPVIGHKRVVSTSSVTLGHPLSSCPPSRRPSSRAGGRTPVIHSRSLSRAPSFGPAFDKTGLGLETVPDLDVSLTEEVLCRTAVDVIEEVDATEEVDIDFDQSMDAEYELDDGRSRSTKKRGRRGARKSKLLAGEVSKDQTLEVLASASQTLAREISLASRSSSLARPLDGSLSSPVIDISRAASKSSSKAPVVLAEAHVNAVGVSTLPSLPPAKKASKWKLSFGGKGNSSPVEDVAPGTASNVTSLIMGLSPSPPTQLAAPTSTGAHQNVQAHQSPSTRPPLPSQRSPADEATIWTRGRRPQPHNPNTWGPSTGNGHAYNSASSAFGNGAGGGAERKGPRGLSPQSTRGGADLTSSASSIMSSSAKSNWRSSMSTTSSASTSTSAFTRYSNSSARSVSTTATSVSSGSWRAQGTTSSRIYGNNREQQAIPKNVKIMSGVPWELYELPRQLHPNPVGDIFGQPPPRKIRTRKPKDSKLDTISERPGAPQKSPVRQRCDAATSTTDLDGVREGSDAGSDGAPKKVQKGQINALAKMLSALRR
ncbi:kinase-like protein [Melanogaster broomeanus]|nr:kinase-like protein [Melanogaster broomeanus]